MKLISTTIAGPGTASIIGDALRSVAPLVDDRYILWTGPECAAIDDPDVARIDEELQPIFWRSWPWSGRFDEARNRALLVASEETAEWALMLDTDERVACPDPAAVRAFLEALAPEVEVVVARAADGSHSRERFFRLPAKHRWIGRTHEAFPVDPGQQATIPASLISWAELPKSLEQLRAKHERDVVLLAQEIEEHPDDARWWFYMGVSLAALGRTEEAIEAYRAAADRGRGEDSALACVRAAELLIMEKRYEEAVAACARGLTIRPDIAELPWLAAGASFNAGELLQAEAWARLAQVHGEFGSGRDALRRRVSFRSPRALRHGPQEILDLVRTSARAQCGTVAGAGRPCEKPYGHGGTVHRWRDARGVMGLFAEGEDLPTERVRITVTSTAVNAERWAARCTESVLRQTANGRHVYVAADSATFAVARTWAPWAVDGSGRGLLENILPVWRSLPDDEVIVWLDGDDWLATDEALAIIAEEHARGALATYGCFMLPDGRPIMEGPCGPSPRAEPWRLSHLKSFRAGLAKRIRDEDLRRPDGAYVDLAIDRAVMLPIVEMAAERAVYIPRILCVYNHAHSFEANASAEAKTREAAEVARIHALPRYQRVAWP